MTFKDLDLHSDILNAIEKMGFETPTPVQSQSIPIILGKKDLCACAPTGTGKTAAFILPILNLLALSPQKPNHCPRALILVPTRELAIQVSTEAEKFSRYLEKMTTVCIYGGVPYPVQKRNLSRPYEILVATPGRLIDHLERGRLKLSKLEILVLDEADRMLDMGFIEPVEKIASLSPKERQTLFFSATMKESVIRLAKNLLKDPEKITVTPPKETHDHIEQKMLKVDDLEHKHRLLEHILQDPNVQNTIIFTSTKSYADVLLNRLEDTHEVAVLHGDIPQRKRTNTISSFRKGKIKILVATDVAARGIDIPSISHVINFDLPNNPTDYIHRIGRTGRAGASGTALSFVSNKDMPVLRDLEKAFQKKISFFEIPGLEPKHKSSYKEKKSNHFEAKGKRRDQRPFYKRKDEPQQGKKTFNSEFSKKENFNTGFKFKKPKRAAEEQQGQFRNEKFEFAKRKNKDGFFFKKKKFKRKFQD